LSGETERHISGWTTDTLKEYLEARIVEADKRYQQRFDAQEAAQKYAQEKANEFRGSLDDVGKKQMPRTEAEALIKASAERTGSELNAINQKVDMLISRMDRNEGRGSGLNSGWGYLIGGVGLIVLIITTFFALRGR